MKRLLSAFRYECIRACAAAFANASPDLSYVEIPGGIDSQHVRQIEFAWSVSFPTPGSIHLAGRSESQNFIRTTIGYEQ